MTITELVRLAHAGALDKGWYDKGPRPVPELLCLIHSEVSEALEEYRDNKGTTQTYYEPAGKPCGFPSELADVLIRAADLAGYLGIDLEQAVAEKIAYNKTRPYRHNGKVV